MLKSALNIILVLILLFTSSLKARNLYFYIGAAFISPIKKISKIYEKENNVKVVIISGGSRLLLEKIILSKKGDLYLPGSMYYEKLARKYNLIIKSVKLVKQIPVFGLSHEGVKKIKSFNDLCNNGIKIILGNPKTMALGLIFYKISRNIPGNIIECINKNTILKATNVAQIANYLKMNIADAGILFESVAKINKLKYIEIPDKFRIDDVAPLIILKTSSNLNESEKFFNFIVSHKFIFENYGYKTF